MERLGVDYASYVLPWDDFRKVQVAFLEASVPEADIARLASAVGAIAEAMEEYFSIPQLRIGDRFAAELKMRAALDRYHGGA